ncbi:hypothetical protein AB1Y20_005090 [Prymnesium parvum]|uniref:Uncharacterized protein n=1 Tax=Prymnesium parvum TaxID=97485 RepID=A0AB34J3B4_PRYPA
MGCGASHGPNSKSLETEKTTPQHAAPPPSAAPSEEPLLVHKEEEPPPRSGRRVARSKPFWEVHEASRHAAAPPECDSLLAEASSPKSVEAEAAALAGASACDRDAWDVCDIDEGERKKDAFPLPPRPPLAVLPPLGSLPSELHLRTSLAPLRPPPMGATLAPLPRLGARLPMLDSPAKPPPPPAGSPSRHPLSEICTNAVQRFEASPAASPDLKARGGVRHEEKTEELAVQRFEMSPAASPDLKARGGARREEKAEETRARRAVWAAQLVLDVVTYEKNEERPPLDYKANLAAIEQMRNERRAKGQRQLSFREYIRELDMAEGGEALSCLSPGPPREETWGQLLSIGK